MIDTHTHLYLDDYRPDGSVPGDMSGQCAAVDRAIAAGVEHMILPGVDLASVPMMHALNDLRPAGTSVALGLHPTELGDDWEAQLHQILAHFDDGRRYVAVGETGIDLYWDTTRLDAQQQAFDRQLAEARRRSLPVIIHCRQALDQTLEVLSGHPGVEAVFHSFGGTAADVERIRAAGDFYFGINGIVTFKNARVSDVLPVIGMERLLTETDSPWLAPTPYRGKRNESSYLPLVAARMAQALDTDIETIGQTTAQNARTLFKLK